MLGRENYWDSNAKKKFKKTAQDAGLRSTKRETQKDRAETGMLNGRML